MQMIAAILAPIRVDAIDGGNDLSGRLPVRQPTVAEPRRAARHVLDDINDPDKNGMSWVFARDHGGSCFVGNVVRYVGEPVAAVAARRRCRATKTWIST